MSVKSASRSHRSSGASVASASLASDLDDDSTVAPGLQLSDHLKNNKEQLYKIPLTPLNCSFGVVTERDDEIQTLSELVQMEAETVRAQATLVFAVRRPGCGGCREHGLQLTQLAAQEKKLAVWGIVKETKVDDTGLLDFYEKYFRFPLYKDSKWMVYKAMGNRKLTMKGLLRGLMKSRSRHKSKKIDQTTLGEGWLQGGLLIFDRNGQLRFSREEVYGDELNLEELSRAIQLCRLAE